MLKVGIIGAGDFGREHAKAIAQTSNVELVAACRNNQKALLEFCNEFECQGYTDYKDLLADSSIDVVVVATPHHLHTGIVVDAARAQKHILLEKPMAPTLPECDEILKAVKEAGVQLMLSHVNHFVPAYIKAKELLTSGELGEVIYAHSVMSKQWMTPNRRNWHLDREQGGGMWLTIGVHVLDQLRWLIDAPVTHISADLQTRFHEQKADDTGVALLRFANGSSATAVSIGYTTGVFTFLTELTCSNGMLRISHSDGLQIGKDETWHKVPDTASENWMDTAMLNEWQAFSKAITENNTMPVTGDYAREIMQVAFAAELSSQEKREVHLI